MGGRRFVSRKNLPLVHLLPAEAAAGIHMAQPLHQGRYISGISCPSGQVKKPVAEDRTKGRVPSSGNESCLFDQFFIRSQCDFLHNESSLPNGSRRYGYGRLSSMSPILIRLSRRGHESRAVERQQVPLRCADRNDKRERFFGAGLIANRRRIGRDVVLRNFPLMP